MYSYEQIKRVQLIKGEVASRLFSYDKKLMKTLSQKYISGSMLVTLLPLGMHRKITQMMKILNGI